MDFPNKRHSVNQYLAVIIANCAAALLMAPTTSLAQVPYSIDGVVPDADCCFEFRTRLAASASSDP